MVSYQNNVKGLADVDRSQRGGWRHLHQHPHHPNQPDAIVFRFEVDKPIASQLPAAAAVRRLCRQVP